MASDFGLSEWREVVYKPFAEKYGERGDILDSTSGCRLPELLAPRGEYATAEAEAHYIENIGFPGVFPFTRSVTPTGYRGKLWTMRQYAGFSTAKETNERYHFLLKAGQTGLSVAFDLPTQMGYASNDRMSFGEVGKAGVPIDTVDDMRMLFSGIPLDEVSTSMTINAPAMIILAFYQVIAEEQGVSPAKLRGTIQNDILKEYMARGTYIFPPAPSMKLTVDSIRYLNRTMPKWNTISISGYHIREAGCTAIQEVAFTLADGIAYCEAAIQAGLGIDEFAPRLSFFFNAHNNFLEEIAKFRTARRLWARIMRDRFGAKDARSMHMRFHTQTAGSMLTAQQPMNNIVRTAYQALAAVLGGTQSLHTNSFDEALALPCEESVEIALRTQQLIAYESGVADTIDPLAGSYFIEDATDRIESGAREYISRIDDMGGMVYAIEQGFPQREIHNAAYAWQRQVESKARAVVGVNRFEHSEKPTTLSRVSNEDAEREQVNRLEEYLERRSPDERARVNNALGKVGEASEKEIDICEAIIDAARVGATEGEIVAALVEVWGRYREDSTM